MSQVSKRIINKDIEDRLYEIFWECLAKINSPLEARKFFDSFISSIEKTMLAKRIGIALMLYKGFTYKVIENTLKVSTGTIRHVNLRQIMGESGITPTLKRIVKNEKSEEFWNNIEELILQLSPQAKVGSIKFLSRQSTGKQIYKIRKTREIL